VTTPQDVRSELRRRLHGDTQRTYWLVEFQGSIPPLREAFLASSDGDALERALDVAEGDRFEVWEGERLVRRWTLAEKESRSFTRR
jgi:hypothetical protein